MMRWAVTIGVVTLVVGGAVAARTLGALNRSDDQGLLPEVLARAERVHAARTERELLALRASWARRFHQGQLPCGRWQPPSVSPEQLVAAIERKGLTEDAVDFSDWLRWRFERNELDRHGALTDAERLAPALEGLEGLEGELLRGHTEQALAALRNPQSAHRAPTLLAHLERVESALPLLMGAPADGPREKLESLAGDYAALANDWTPVDRALREQLTQERFDALAKLLTEAAANGEAEVPARLVETHRTRLRRLDVDGFGQPISVKREGDEVVLRSSAERALRFRAPVYVPHRHVWGEKHGGK